MSVRFRRQFLIFWWLAYGLIAGCSNPLVHSIMTEFATPPVSEAEVKDQRAKFIEQRDPAAFRWLVTHALRNGMTVREVNHTMGDDGVRIYGDQQLKARLEGYLESDECYKWGPATNGQSVVLIFRGNRLVNYDPKDFRAMSVSAED